MAESLTGWLRACTDDASRLSKQDEMGSEENFTLVIALPD